MGESRPNISLNKSNIVDCGGKIDWGYTPFVQLIVYQFDEGDTEYEGESEGIEYYEAENISQFKDVLTEAINYADKVAKRDFTPMTVVMIGYDEDREPVDEYWETIYYVKPTEETH